MAPFEQGLLGSMSLVSADTRLVPCPYLDSFASGADTYAFAGDAAGHAVNYVPTTRTWSNSTFVAGLSNDRTSEEKDALVEEVHQGSESNPGTRAHARTHT